MKKYIVFVFLLGLSTCNIKPEEIAEVNSYFNIEELLNDEIDYLLAQNAGLEKKVVSNGEEERFEIQPADTAAWEAQLSLFFEANIDKAGYRDAFFEESLTTFDGNDKIIYTAKSSKTPIQTFECLYLNDVLSQISIQLIEKNTIFSSVKRLKLYLDPKGEHIIGFDVSGEEEMRLKEKMSFNVEAVITY